MRVLPPRTTRDHRSEAVLLPGFLFLAGAAGTLLMAEKNYSYEFLFSSLTAACMLHIAVAWALWVSRASRACSPANLQIIPSFRKQVAIHAMFVWLAMSMALGAVFSGFHVVIALVAIIAFALMLRRPATRRIVFVIGTLAWMMGSAALYATAHAFPERALSAPDAGHIAAMFGTAFILLGVVGVSRRYRWLATTLCFAYLTASFAGYGGLIVDIQLNFIAIDFSTDFIGTLGLLLAATLLQWLTVQYLTQRGGDRAVDKYRYDLGVRAAVSNLAKRDEKIDWSIARTPKAKSLARTDHYIASRRGPLELLSLAIAPGLKRSDMIATLLILVAFITLTTLLNPAAVKTFHTSGAGKVMLCLPMMICLVPGAIWLGIWRNRQNQAILSLTPHWPERPILNRWFILYVLELSLVHWIGSLIAILAITLVHSVPYDIALRAAAGSTIVALIVIGTVLQDYSRESQVMSHTNLNVAFLATLGIVPLVGLLVFIPQSPQLIISLCLVLGVCFVGTRIYLRLIGPAMLPPGRA